MATLDDMMEEDIAAVFLDTDEHAEAISYTPVGGVLRSISAIVEFDEQILTSDFSDGRGAAKTARLFIAHNDTDGVASPVEGDAVTLADSSTWKVKGQPDSDNFGGCWLTIVRWEQTEKSGRNFRTQR